MSIRQTVTIFFAFTILLTGICLANNIDEGAQEDKIILEIVIPLDNKTDEQFGHTIIWYQLKASGLALDMRSVYGWAHQASRKKQLSQNDITEIMKVVKKLPIKKGNVVKDKSLIVKYYDEGKEKTLIYKRNKLPKDLEKIFMLLGGVRSEIKDQLDFNL